MAILPKHPQPVVAKSWTTDIGDRASQNKGSSVNCSIFRAPSGRVYLFAYMRPADLSES